MIYLSGTIVYWLAGLILARNIYYQNKELFGDRQEALDKLIDDVAFTLGVGREDLNIVGATPLNWSSLLIRGLGRGRERPYFWAY